jgi:23S rRNA (cytidine2498-2'-O)-methyltransferase
MLEESGNQTPPVTWLIRIPEVFADWEPEILRGLGAEPLRKLGRDYHLIRIGNPEAIHQSEAAKFVSWNLPVHHGWPCDPGKTPGFIEKAAQALFRKFGGLHPQTIIAGALDPGAANRYFRTLASNLRGRTLQLFPPAAGEIRDAEAQDSLASTLFCLVGKEGLFCGMQSPQTSNGFHPGGTKFIRQNAPGAISRAGAKIAEALHHLQLHRPPPPVGGHWLELGASPGGMTAELLTRGYRVTAVDRAPLDPRLQNAPGLLPVLADAATFRPGPGVSYDAILSDMNGAATDSIAHVIRLSGNLRPGGIVIFTLKLPGVTTYAGVNEMETRVTEAAAAAGLRLFARTHLTYNRQEFTLFFERDSSGKPL